MKKAITFILSAAAVAFLIQLAVGFFASEPQPSRSLLEAGERPATQPSTRRLPQN